MKVTRGGRTVGWIPKSVWLQRDRNLTGGGSKRKAQRRRERRQAKKARRMSQKTQKDQEVQKLIKLIDFTPLDKSREGKYKSRYKSLKAIEGPLQRDGLVPATRVRKQWDPILMRIGCRPSAGGRLSLNARVDGGNGRGAVCAHIFDLIMDHH